MGELGVKEGEYKELSEAALLYHRAFDKNEMGEIYDAKQTLKEYFTLDIPGDALQKSAYYEEARKLQQELEE